MYISMLFLTDFTHNPKGLIRYENQVTAVKKLTTRSINPKRYVHDHHVNCSFIYTNTFLNSKFTFKMVSDASKIIFDLFPFTKQTGHFSYVYYNGNKIYLNTYMCINKLRIYQLININSKPIERDRFVTANFQYVTSYKI